jgi:putative ATP-dependent endonuclease of OLD family
MYLSRLTIENFRCFGRAPDHFEMLLQPGLTALVGENDSGKTAVIEAIRFALGTRDQEWYRLEDTDFYEGVTSSEIRIVCKFEGLTALDKRAFVLYLTYGAKKDEEPVFYVNWRAKDTGKMMGGRQYRRVETFSGLDGSGPSLAPEVRDLLRATYLRPLRDAEQALSAGRGSRLAQVLRYSEQISKGSDAYSPDAPLKEQELSVLGIGNLINAMLEKQKGVIGAREDIDKNLAGLTIRGERLISDIKVSGAMASADARLRELLEKLDLRLDGKGKLGLGSDNLLFIACELLLLAQESEGSKLLLIEEPEVHLHAQRQLQVMRFMQEQAEAKGIQIIVTTHSPNLASAIKLNNVVMIRNPRAFSLAEGQTLL